jgi:hypothetical protein
MNWTKAVIAGVVGGFVVNLYSWVMHGMIMGPTYVKYPETFQQEGSNPLWFFVVSISIGVAGALLFGKTRAAWGAGVKGGVTFGFFIGLVSFFSQFYSPLVINGFPYYLSWCWGGISLIGWMVFGAVAALLYKPAA